jgi:hypothetical protein
MTEYWEYDDRPEPFELAAAETRFFPIATMAYERFAALPAYDTHMQIIPLEPGGKRPAKGFLPSRHAVPIKAREHLALLAASYPDANVGICGSACPGGIMVIDIDKPGTRERIDREYGPLPETYTTRTRPVSKPYKQHVYLMQTERLLKFFDKQVTDVTHIAGYDLKCAGGWGYVAAEGSVRDGETITALHDVAIVPIPDSLVDWLVADVAKARAKKRAKAKPEPQPQPETTPQPPCRTYSHRPAVSRDDRHWTIKSRARIWKNTGMSDEQTMPVLLDHICRYFEDGEQLVADPAYVRKVRAMVRKVPTLGDVSYRILTHRRRSRRSTIPLSTVRERFASCPPDITPADARAFFSVRNRADHERLRREFHRHGYTYVGAWGSHPGVWSRHSLPHELSPCSTTSLSTAKKPSSSWAEQHTTHAEPPHHRNVCMSTESSLDQEVAGVRSHTHSDDRGRRKSGGDRAENLRPEAA